MRWRLCYAFSSHRYRQAVSRANTCRTQWRMTYRGRRRASEHNQSEGPCGGATRRSTAEPEAPASGTDAPTCRCGTWRLRVTWNWTRTTILQGGAASPHSKTKRSPVNSRITNQDAGGGVASSDLADATDWGLQPYRSSSDIPCADCISSANREVNAATGAPSTTS